MRPDRLFLLDIVGAADAIVVHVGGRGEEELLADPTARAAVLHELTVIGEAAARISSETRSLDPGIPWAEIIAFRNVVIHEYFGLSWPSIWVTASEDVPKLCAQIAKILETLGDDEPDKESPDE